MHLHRQTHTHVCVCAENMFEMRCMPQSGRGLAMKAADRWRDGPAEETLPISQPEALS